MIEQYRTLIPPIVIEPGEKEARQAVIWLHGLGADGHDFESLVPELKLPEDHEIRFIFPTAPKQPITINLGEQVNAWYDFRTIQLFEEVDWAGIEQSITYIHGLIDEQVASGIDSNHILLAGFSQGGVIALHSTLTYPESLAGAVALSTYFPAKQNLNITQSRSLPIYWGHGVSDPICSYTGAEISRAMLHKFGFEVDWHSYAMQHQVCSEEINDISRFLIKTLVKNSAQTSDS